MIVAELSNALDRQTYISTQGNPYKLQKYLAVLILPNTCFLTDFMISVMTCLFVIAAETENSFKQRIRIVNLFLRFPCCFS